MNDSYNDIPRENDIGYNENHRKSDTKFQFIAFRIIFVALLIVSIIALKFIPNSFYNELKEWYSNCFMADVDVNQYIDESD
mgnify:CR=1 FL=1